MVRVEERADRQTVIVAVPVDAVRDLEREELAFRLPILRGAVVDAVVTVGPDAAALVTLLQAPDTVRAFAAWVRGRCGGPGDSIDLRARRGDQTVHLTVNGDVDVGIVADFLAAAFADHSPQPGARRQGAATGDTLRITNLDED
jgi:hypothetical protein